MSPRAACRLETLGFDPKLVFDYVEGKAGWLANGLPREGGNASILYAGEVADTDPPTCALDTPVADIRAMLDGSPNGFCLVITQRRTVLGRVRRSALDGMDDGATAGQVMESGPSTVRFDVRADELVQRLAKQNLETAVVTTPGGCLVGVFHRQATETRLSCAEP